MKRKIIGILTICMAIIGVTLYVGVSNTDAPTVEKKQDIKDLVAHYSSLKATGVKASIDSHYLTIINEQTKKEIKHDLPEDEFFLSIAPYETRTHDCATHSLTGCQGQLKNEEFEVLITTTDGSILIDQTMTSLDNGFIDLWLPRDKEFNITIKKGDKVAESTISTFKGDNTCNTIMKLL